MTEKYKLKCNSLHYKFNKKKRKQTQKQKMLSVITNVSMGKQATPKYGANWGSIF